MRIAGVMSGTSLDGIDVAIIEMPRAGLPAFLRQAGRPVSLVTGFLSVPYPLRVRRAVLGVSDAQTTTAAISRLNFELGELYAKAVLRAADKFGPVDLIGCHGQTIYHEGARNTLQIGEAGVIAERTGAPVVSNFRARDIAAGGQGAPLVPYVDYLLFRHPKRTRVALNIGGIANLTAIPAGARPNDVTAFDTGPGNMAIDALTVEHTGGRLRYDRNGEIAASGKIDRNFLRRLLADPYYRRKAPKSAGREQYGESFVTRLKESGASLPDLIATATALTAITISAGIRHAAGDGGIDVIVSGGGAHNPMLMAQLAAYLPGAAISDSAAHGIDPDAKEALAFALLAYETWNGRPSNLPSATGARNAVLLGDITSGKPLDALRRTGRNR